MRSNECADGSVLVRVSPEILKHMKTGDVEPVVILGVEEHDDGTHDMTLMTTDLIDENRKLREVLQRIGRVHGPWRPVVADALGCTVDDLDSRKNRA